MYLRERVDFEQDNEHTNAKCERVWAVMSIDASPRYGKVITLRNGDTMIIEDEDG